MAARAPAPVLPTPLAQAPKGARAAPLAASTLPRYTARMTPPLIPPSPSEDEHQAKAAAEPPLPDGADPFALFAEWFEAAKASEPNDPNAVALATTDLEGLPDVRMVLLKDHVAEESEKSKQAWSKVLMAQLESQMVKLGIGAATSAVPLGNPEAAQALSDAASGALRARSHDAVVAA